VATAPGNEQDVENPQVPNVGGLPPAEEVLECLEGVDKAAAVPIKKGKRASAKYRQNFTWRQLSVLEQVFDVDPLPRQALRVQLAERLGLGQRPVQVWFQNRRQKWRILQLSLGYDPPSLKDVSTRLASLEQLLPYASGTDAQRVFTSSHMHDPGIGPPPAPPTGWQQTALGISPEMTEANGQQLAIQPTLNPQS